MVPQPLKLTQEQLEQVMRTAGPIPPDLRGDYLQHVAEALRRTGPFGDGEVYIACRDAAKVVMWNVVRESPQAAPRDRERSRLLTAPMHKGRPIDPVTVSRPARRPTASNR
jgi:hypothetical protein